MNFKSILSGTGVAIITPFNKDFSVDFTALGRLINFIIDDGIQYIVTLGTTGETPVLTIVEKKEIIQFTHTKIAGRVPMIVGIGGNDTASVIDDLQAYNLDGAVAILSASPSYNKPSQQGIYEHYKAIAAASPKPIILYNVPGRTGRNMTSETTIRLAQIPNIIGIKEASGDMQQCMQILKDKPDEFVVLSGDDALALPQIACGMDGVISVAANVFPKQYTEMINNCLDGDFKKAITINNDLMDAYDLLFSENNPAGAKAFLYEMNKIQNVLRLPGVPVGLDVHTKIQQYLKH